jgi:LAGLIDADG endonuclease
MQTTHYPEVPDDFGHWLAGFIDGEGCFYIDFRVRNGWPRYSCSFHLVLRDDDAAILSEIQGRLGVGNLKRARPRGFPGSRPQLRLNVTSLAGCQRIIQILDVFPLRAKKARDYAIWREAVFAWARKGGQDASRRRRGHGPQPHDWSDLRALHRRLLESRSYEPLPPSKPEPEPPPRLWEES